MKTKLDASFGVIPYIYDEDLLKFLVIHQHSHMRKDSYWVFPKGHAEENETPEESARRELTEETQLQLASLNTEKTFEIKYYFVHNGTRIEKSVQFFLGEAASKEYTIQEKELIEASWCTYEEAREKITFENTKKVLDAAKEYLVDVS